MTHHEPIAVSQEARDAAAGVRAWCDDMNEPEMVQAFQRAMTQAAEAAAKDMRERCAKVAEGHVERLTNSALRRWTVQVAKAQLASHIATAIRALSASGVAAEDGKGLR